jgi:hypothetical protein
MLPCMGARPIGLEPEADAERPTIGRRFGDADHDRLSRSDLAAADLGAAVIGQAERHGDRHPVWPGLTLRLITTPSVGARKTTRPRLSARCRFSQG